MRFYDFEVIGLLEQDNDSQEIEDFFELDMDLTPDVYTMSVDLDKIGAYKKSIFPQEGQKDKEVVVIYTSGFEIILDCSLKRFEDALYKR